MLPQNLGLVNQANRAICEVRVAVVRAGSSLFARTLVALAGHQLHLARDEPLISDVAPSVLRGPYQRRPRTLRQRLLRIGLLVWLWIAAAILGLVLIILYLVGV